MVGGDGTGSALGKGSAGEWYWTSAQYKRYYCRPSLKSCNQGDSWTELEPALVSSSDAQPFFVRFAPVQTDPTGAAFLTATTYGIFRSDSTPAWTLLRNTYPTAIREVFASQTTPGLYGAVLNGGRATVTSDAGSTWTTAGGQIGVGSQRVTLASSIAFPPVLPPGKAAGDVYLLSTRAWVLADATPIPPVVGHLFLTTDRGATFAALHGDGSGQDLPNLPIYVVRFDPGDATGATIYAGTAAGLYRSSDAGRTWQRYGNGLPLVAVSDLYVSKNQSLIRAATYGRGLWEIYPAATAARGIAGDGDFDRNGRIDWADVAALASRLGTTPATIEWPTYSWYSDLVSAGSPAVAGNAIDEADLAALLDRLGDHP